MPSIGDGEVDQMNAVADIQSAHRFACTLEDAEAARRSIPITEARKAVARKLGVAPGTLEGIRRLRTKIIPAWLMARIRAAFVVELQTEITRLQHEIYLARQTGAGHSDDALCAAETQVATAKALLGAAEREE